MVSEEVLLDSFVVYLVGIADHLKDRSRDYSHHHLPMRIHPRQYVDRTDCEDFQFLTKQGKRSLHRSENEHSILPTQPNSFRGQKWAWLTIAISACE